MVKVELTSEQLWEIIKALKIKAEHCRKGYRRHPGPERLEQIVLIEGLVKHLVGLHEDLNGHKGDHQIERLSQQDESA